MYGWVGATLCGAGFVLDVHGLFSHCEIEKQVPNSKHSKVESNLISEVIGFQTCQSDRSVVLACVRFVA